MPEDRPVVYAQATRTRGRPANWHKAMEAFWDNGVYYTMCFLLVRDTWTISNELPSLRSGICMHCWEEGEFERLHSERADFDVTTGRAPKMTG